MRGRFPTYFASDYDRLVTKEGRCDLTAERILPLFNVYQFSSQGWREGAHSWLAREVADLMSRWEIDYFLTRHVRPEVTRIACQFALPPEESLAAAKRLGKCHPQHQGKDVIMTTDFMLLEEVSAVPTWRAVAVKRKQDLTERVMEKLEIEEECWRKRNVKWSLVLDVNISNIVARNVEGMMGRYAITSLPCSIDEAKQIVGWLTPYVLTTGHTLGAICFLCGRALDLPKGLPLAVAHHAIIRRFWPVDFNQPIVSDRPVPLLSDSSVNS